MVGGGSKPSGSTTTVQKADPWEGQQPFLKEQFGAAQSLYNTKMPQYDQGAYDKALAEWNTANAGAAPQYDEGEYQAALNAFNSGGGSKPEDEAKWLASKGLNPNLSASHHTYLDYASNFKPTPTGPAPDREKFLIPGAAGLKPTLDKFAIPGTENSSALAPAYYPGQTIADQTPETLLAQNLMTQRALAGSPITNTASGLLTDNLSGKYLDPATNPGFKQGLTDIADTYRYGVAPQTDSMFGRSGAYGGSAYNEAVQRNQRGLADSMNKYAGELYDTERNRQMQSMLFAPTMAQQDYADALQLGNVGAAKEARNQALIGSDIDRYNYNSSLPATALANYIGLTDGNYGGSQTATSPYYTNPSADFLGTGLGLLSGASAIDGLAGGGLFSGLFGGASTAPMWMGPFAASDIRLKTNITRIGMEKGFPVYSFRYRADPDGILWRGVMAQDVMDIMPEAVGMIGEYYAVDYGMIGVEFGRVH